MNTLLAYALFAISATKNVAGEYLLGTNTVRAERSISLTNRYPDRQVNDVFKYNIIHTLEHMDLKSYSFILQPGEVFAFHEDVLPQFEGKVAKTTNAHFNWTDGFKSDGYLMGDGVCHLASLMYVAARDAGLEALAPTNHDFADIPQVPREYGVSIYFMPGAREANARQNLYITNTRTKPVEFAFAYDNDNLTVRITD